MAIQSHRPIISACRSWLRPVARWLLRSGVTYRAFAELERAAFVDTATEEFGLRGRPTNGSRVALLTGLARREVRRVRSESSGAGAGRGEESHNHATRVLSGWHQDADFLEPDGRPRVLSATEPAPSFTSSEDMTRLYKLEDQRAALAPVSAFVLKQVMSVLSPARMVISMAGIRDGIVYDFYNQ